jgi:hypothetical protein
LARAIILSLQEREFVVIPKMRKGDEMSALKICCAASCICQAVASSAALSKGSINGFARFRFATGTSTNSIRSVRLQGAIRLLLVVASIVFQIPAQADETLPPCPANGGSTNCSITVTGRKWISENKDGPAGGFYRAIEKGRGERSGLSRDPSNRAEPPSNSNSSPNSDCAGSTSGNPSTGTPVVIATGEKWLSQDDFSGNGLNALPFGRTYRSIERPGVAYMFGPGWLSSYDYPGLDTNGPEAVKPVVA